MTIKPKTSRGLRVLPPKAKTSNHGEFQKLKRTVDEIEQWWQQSRWKHTKRTYTAQDVAVLRPSNPSSTAPKNASYSNTSSLKLYSLLEKLYAKGGYSHTFGALDPVQVTQMAPHLSSIYVSGWQCSSTASSTNEPGPDFADYPMNTVPNKVDHLVKAQLFHDRRQHNERSMKLLQNNGASLDDPVDYLVPVVADGDTGHGKFYLCMILHIFYFQCIHILLFHHRWTECCHETNQAFYRSWSSRSTF